MTIQGETDFMESENDVTVSELTHIVVRFRDDREWKQFHNPKDLALSLLLEVGELIELMQWKNGVELENYLREKRDEVSDEIADILYWVLLIAHDFDIDLTKAFKKKMADNAEKYPIGQAHGNSCK